LGQRGGRREKIALVIDSTHLISPITHNYFLFFSSFERLYVKKPRAMLGGMWGTAFLLRVVIGGLLLFQGW
jgi:hypothetical protein